MCFRPLSVLLTCTSLFLAANSASAAEGSQLLPLTDDAARELERGKQQGLIEIAAVHLPEESTGECNHFGWPIATKAGDTIVVMHRRIPGHRATGAGNPEPSMSYGIVLRSDDGGTTWSKPYDLRECMAPADRNRGGIVPLSHRAKFDKSNKSSEGYKVHLHSIGTTRTGAIVAISNHGVFRSDDAGRTWQHFSTALRDDNFPHQIVNVGPRILDSPEHGLMVFGNWFGEANSYHKLHNQLVTLKSADNGANWSVEENDAGFPQYEPAALLHNDQLRLVTRDQTHVRAHRQMTWRQGQSPTVVDTNLKDPRLVDTVDFCFNPVTQRFEIVRSERHKMELWLWSIAPDEWNTGIWQRECRLLARKGKFYSTADGFHPAAAVIDRKRNVQHIFVYSGHPNGPAGVFRITRTLDTPRLAAAMKDSEGTAVLPSLTKGGVVLTFDDRNFDDWTKHIPLFNEFSAKATFFINGKIDKPAIDAIQQLRKHGHAIGSHSVHHLKAVEFCEKQPTEEFLRQEVHPQLDEFRSIGVAPSSFAYPMSRNNAETDLALLNTFRHLRTGKSIGPGVKICETEAFFVPAAQIAQHGCLYGKGIDYAGEHEDRTFAQIDSALTRAAANQEIIVFYAHGISESKKGHFITPDALARVLGKARDLQLQFYTFDQLP